MKCRIRFIIALFVVLAFVSGCCNGRISWLPTSGEIFNNQHYVTVQKFEGRINAEWAYLLEPAFKDSRCDVVLVWIESGGGYVADAELLAHNLSMLKEKYNKSLWVFSQQFLASGAYWAALSADTIAISCVGKTGSIGAVLIRPDFSKADSIRGEAWWIFQSGELKTLGNAHTPISDLEKLKYMTTIKEIHGIFMSRIFEHRFDKIQKALGCSEHDSLAVQELIFKVSDGGLMSAWKAYEYGLIDVVCYFDELLEWFRNQGLIVKTMDGKVIENFYLEE